MDEENHVTIVGLDELSILVATNPYVPYVRDVHAPEEVYELVLPCRMLVEHCSHIFLGGRTNAHWKDVQSVLEPSVDLRACLTAFGGCVFEERMLGIDSLLAALLVASVELAPANLVGDLLLKTRRSYPLEHKLLGGAKVVVEALLPDMVRIGLYRICSDHLPLTLCGLSQKHAHGELGRLVLDFVVGEYGTCKDSLERVLL